MNAWSGDPLRDQFIWLGGSLSVANEPIFTAFDLPVAKCVPVGTKAGNDVTAALVW